jgi:hypothetical protein
MFIYIHNPFIQIKCDKAITKVCIHPQTEKSTWSFYVHLSIEAIVRFVESGWFGLWFLTPLSTIFQLYRVLIVEVTGER